MNVDLASILHGTPLWVFALFAYLLWTGIRSLTASVRKLGLIWITPAIFIVWGLIGLFARSGSVTHWLIAAVVGGGLGALAGVSVQLDREKRLVVLPGSVFPLIRNLAIFGAHYVLAVLAALKPQMSAHYLAGDVYVSGLGAGYFVGWTIRFVMSYRQAIRRDANLDVRVLSSGRASQV